MTHSRAYRLFKREMGQVNHYLVTLMVGLDAVREGAEKKDGFSIAWNPKNKIDSANRSSIYAKKASLAWAVDNLDMYLRLCNRKPVLFRDEESSELAKTKHSVYRKYECVIKNHTEIERCMKAFVDLLICWRNNMVHYDAENKLQWETSHYFSEDAKNDTIVLKYHLDVDIMIGRFYDGQPPSLKEIATLISMTIHFVKQLDEILLRELDKKQFVEVMLQDYFKAKKEAISIFNKRNSDDEKTIKKIKQLLVTEYGIQDDFYDENITSYLIEVAKMSKSEYIKRYLS